MMAQMILYSCPSTLPGFLWLSRPRIWTSVSPACWCTPLLHWCVLLRLQFCYFSSSASSFIHIWFLIHCEYTTNCSTIGILLSIVVQFKCHRGYLVTQRDSSLRISHLVPYPLWMLYSSYQLFHHRHLVVYCGSIQVSPWLSCYPTWHFNSLHATFGS